MIRLILAICLLGFYSHAEEVKQKKTQTEKITEVSKNFLWRLKGGASDVYIMGSIHVGNEKLYPLNQAAEKAFKECKRLGLEVEMSSKNMGVIQTAVMRQSQYEAGKDLSDDFSEEELALIGKWMGTMMPKAAWVRMKPWFHYLMVMNMFTQRAGLVQGYGIDHYFYKKAKKEAKKILELESARSQMNMLINLPDTKKALIESCKYSNEKARAEMLKLLKCVKEGDNKVLLEVIAELKKTSEKMHKIMFTDRNINMAKKVEEWMKEEGGTFVVMGAAHTLGEGGVIELLKAKGYKLERL